MKRIVILIISAALLLFGLNGCDKKETTTTTPAGNQTPAVNEKASSGEVSLSDIMKKTQEIKGVYYEMKMSMKGPQGQMTTNAKTWVSGNKMRMEMEMMGTQTITIATGDGTVYVYMPATKTAMKTTAPQNESANQWAYKDISKYKVLGREKINGQQCIIVSTDSPATKSWIIEEIGMPLKSEVQTAEGLTTAEFTNIKLGPQPDDLFTLPAGTNITNFPGM